MNNNFCLVFLNDKTCNWNLNGLINISTCFVCVQCYVLLKIWFMHLWLTLNWLLLFFSTVQKFCPVQELKGYNYRLFLFSYNIIVLMHSWLLLQLSDANATCGVCALESSSCSMIYDHKHAHRLREFKNIIILRTLCKDYNNIIILGIDTIIANILWLCGVLCQGWKILEVSTIHLMKSTSSLV